MAKRKKIAIVDDEIEPRKAFKRILSLSYVVDAFIDGQELINSYCPGEYAAIIMDTDMRKSIGYEVCAEIRKRDQEVVIIGFSADNEYASRWINAGANEFLQKPVRTDLLETILQQHLNV